jgi:hypothetical protein
MNRQAGFASPKSFSGSVRPFLPLLILISIFLPLPLLVLPMLFFISLVLQPRAAPAVNQTVPVRFIDLPSLRSPPF